jgi:hypothetical protein
MLLVFCSSQKLYGTLLPNSTISPVEAFLQNKLSAGKVAFANKHYWYQASGSDTCITCNVLIQLLGFIYHQEHMTTRTIKSPAVIQIIFGTWWS